MQHISQTNLYLYPSNGKITDSGPPSYNIAGISKRCVALHILIPELVVTLVSLHRRFSSTKSPPRKTYLQSVCTKIQMSSSTKSRRQSKPLLLDRVLVICRIVFQSGRWH